MFHYLPLALMAIVAVVLLWIAFCRKSPASRLERVFCLFAVGLIVIAVAGCEQPGRSRRPAPLPSAPAADDHRPDTPPVNDDPTVEIDVRNIADKVTQYTPNAQQPPPQTGNFGYKPNPEGTKEFLRSLPKPDIRSAAPHLFDPKARVKQINMQQPGDPRGPPFGAKDPTLLYRALLEVSPGWKVGAQGIGDCVSWGNAHAVDVAAAVDRITGKTGQWQFAATEPIYGGSRVEARGKPEGSGGYSDGSYGAAAAKWLKNFGVVHREPFTDLGYDLTKYSKDRAKSWGNYGCGGQGDRGRLDAIAKKHPVGQVALVRSFDEAAAAIESGYPVAVCSGRGLSRTRDKDGFAAPSGSWAHCMCFTGVRYDRPGLLCQNSWGTTWISGPKWPVVEMRSSRVTSPMEEIFLAGNDGASLEPLFKLTAFQNVTEASDQPDGSFWVDATVATSMLRGEDSFAITGTQGFPLRELRHDLGW
jgi:hypothetical protein